ncbi:sigma-70 family RNA polymerase sigma factor [Nocardia otitidiscaviarum]|uniref:Sigma-70 family RNA polymerase sigma factor n=1 Tax=Nocardia otitidiscaviarum TaxID=1823 RepID=A0A516NP51_9NOCA|nr:sigma-70 family RNA polymerase sigma factor [Nocardia otitidiscaviarum]MCP9624039.1 sigma-70 family RNA polymerase sigma factor [Nocardia otitidiscaviarum]QDP80698.1 sigma-70 family RNA polymerase sigma factor [Nocardia otitidiscaviarum]
MSDQGELARQFEAQRSHLHAVGYRMLGSWAAAEDAVQDTWLRLYRTDPAEVANLSAWLTTVVSRICLDRLRSRTAHPEHPLDDAAPDLWDTTHDPEQAAVQADSVGRALLVVLDRLSPAERVAFVLHDVFAVPFDQIAAVVDRTPTAAKQLASRARRRVRGNPAVSPVDLARHRRVVEAFLDAAHTGNVEALLAILAPDVVRRADAAAVPTGTPLTAHGITRVTEDIARFGRRAAFAEPALIDGTVGAVVAPRGHLTLVLRFQVEGTRITEYEVIADPDRLRTLAIATLP